MTDGLATTDETHIRIAKAHAAGDVVLDRVETLNALTDDMRAALKAALPDFARDPVIYAMVIRSASAKAFSAGGDVRQLVAQAKTDPAGARASFAAEYALNWALECFSKPTVSLIDGMIAGSGVGLSLYGTHRVAGPGYRFAMPEVQIGLFPDVGVCHALSRMPDEIGTYLALTGHFIGRADALALGLATHALPAAGLTKTFEALSDAEPVDILLDGLSEDAGAPELLPHREKLAAWFAGDDVREIRERIAFAAPSDPFAASCLGAIDAAAPLSLVVTLKHLRETTSRDLRETLIADYRLACGFLAAPDFAEGVRAQLIDKDKTPSWRPQTLAESGDADLAPYFDPPADGDLDLPTRAELQSA